RAPRAPLFPYTTLFRSRLPPLRAARALAQRAARPCRRGVIGGEIRDRAPPVKALVEATDEELAAGAVEEEVRPRHREIRTLSIAVADDVEADELAALHRDARAETR